MVGKSRRHIFFPDPEVQRNILIYIFYIERQPF